MPPGRYLSHRTSNIDVFDPRVLGTSGGLRTALRTFQGACYQGDRRIGDIISALIDHPYILEYIISALDEDAYRKLSKWMVSEFPAPTTPNVINTMSMRLIQRFSSSLLSMEYPSVDDSPPDLRVFWRKAGHSFNVLQELENTKSALTRTNIFVSRKKSRMAPKIRRIDPLPFNSMGISVPTTDMEVRDAYVEVLSQLQDILEYYLLVLREPPVSKIFKSSIVGPSYTKANPSSETVFFPTMGRAVEIDQYGGPVCSTVQPMMAALYFGNVRGFGVWSILLSTRAEKYLRDVKRTEGAIFQIVMEKIKQLSQGHFSNDNQKPLTGPGTALPIYEARTTVDIRLVYQIDCIPNLKDPHSECECQVIRIFGVFTHAQLDRGRFWDSFSRQLRRGGPEHIKRCNFRNEPLSAGGNVILPATFPSLPNQAQDTTQAARLAKVREEDMDNVHSMMLLDRFDFLSRALLNSILADKEVTHVFPVSPQEQEIIECPSSCYVIGRSGTGKTTMTLFKMLAIQRTWEQYPEMGSKPRQVFVTRSPLLAMKVEGDFAKLMASLEVADYSPEGLHMMKNYAKQDVEFVDQDDNERWTSDMPERFSDLLDEHFPLFVTYDRLCAMLQNDIGKENDNDGFIIPKTYVGDEGISPTNPTSPQRSRLRAGTGSASSSGCGRSSCGNFISYVRFSTSYWDHFPERLTRALDPALVFGEFMGVIKGSEDTIGTKDRCLDRESYKALSARTQGTFSHKRDDIYDLFMAYTKLKRERQDYDTADRTHYLLKQLRDVGITGKKVDILYVDEVQDLLLIDTLILRTICANKNGLFSIGSSFRFDDLKAYQHRIEEALSRKGGHPPAETKTFELVSNYRSHGGIVNCARSVVELIMRYWRNSIDVLEPERAIIGGPRPVFFASQGEASRGEPCRGKANFEESFFGGGRGETVEYGADQCAALRS